MTNIPIRRCSRCAAEKPETPEYFYVSKAGRNGFLAACMDCIKAARRKHVAENRDALNAEKREAWERDKEVINAGRREAWATAPESVRGSNKRWREANPEKALESRQKTHKKRKASGLIQLASYSYYRANKETVLERNRRYAEANPAVLRTRGRNRRARVRRVPGSHTTAEVLALYEAQGRRCAYCRTELNGVYHGDHIIPISRPELNPTNDISNIALACEACNLNKHNKTPAEWIVRWYQVEQAAN